MILTIKPTTKLRGEISAPPSKSYTHRAVIISALAKGTSKIKNPLISEDTEASIDACRKIGAEIKTEKKEIKIKGVSGKPETPKELINVRNSGTTLRIMTPITGLCNGITTLTGDESIQKRPMQPLLDALEQLGAKTTSTDGKAPITIHGPIKGGVCNIRGDISSQFISGLLITAPLTEKGATINITTPLKSKPYIDLTLDLMKKYGAKYEKTDNVFKVPGNQTYKSTEYVVEGDYSSAALILAAAAITESEIKISNLKPDSKQGDKKIIEILKSMEVPIKTTKDSVIVNATGKLRAIEVDLGDNPDLVPPIAVLGALAEGKTVIKNIPHLRYKESDRIKTITTELTKMGANIKASEDSIEIHGVKQLKGTTLHGHGDHRIVMSLAAAALKAKGETKIDSAESIPTSFPNYVETMKILGAEINLS